MPGRGNDYQEKANAWLDILYYVIVIGLIITIGLMYREWQGRKLEYDRLVREAAAQEQNVEIELRKVNSDLEESVEEGGL